MESPIAEIATIVALAVASSWVASRLKVPSIVVLLTVGVLAGPVFRILDPDALVGDLLAPGVSIAVGLILFEGGLSLRFHEIRGNARAIWLLVTAGVVVTWVLGAVAAQAFIDIPGRIAVLLGAILIVSGPTVIGPILTSVRPRRSVSAVLKWESIVIDPIGAMLAVLAFEVVLLGAGGSADGVVGEGVRFVVAGVVAGVVVAVPFGWLVRRHLLPERLIPLMGFAAALVAFAGADAVARESGLLAAPVLGVVLANNAEVRTEPLIHFSEIVQTLLVGVLFVMLSARLTRDQLALVSWGAVGLIVVLVVIARPLAVAVSTWRSGLDRQERLFLAGVAPRGIVAAAVASVFALELEHAGVEGGEILTPMTFVVIVATVLLYGFGAGPLARRLGLAEKTSQGVLVVGAGPVERTIGGALSEEGISVVFATTNRRDEMAARMQGHRTYYGNLIDHEVPYDLDLAGIGRQLALTPNDEVNTLSSRTFAPLFGAAETFQIAAEAPGPGIERSPADIGGRTLFDPGLTYAGMQRRLRMGEEIRRTTLSEEFTADDLRSRLDPGGHVLFLVRGERLIVGAADDAPLLDRAQPGDTVLWLPASEPPE